MNLATLRRPLVTLAVAAALAAAAAGVASLALFAVATGLALLTACGAVTVALAANRVTVTRSISAREVEEDAPIHLRFTVEGRTWLPFRLEIEDHAGGWTALAGSQVSIELSVSRRGAHWLAPSRLRVRDPLGICEWQLLAGRAEPLLILPTPDAATSIRSGHTGPVDDPEPQGLQPYAPGMSIARVHWPALARGAGLQVRHFTQSQSGLPLVIVDTADVASSQALDWAARTAAGYILALAHSGGCRVLLPGDARETNVTDTAGDWRAMHRRLAMLSDGPPHASRPPPHAPRSPHAPRTARSRGTGTGTGILHVRAAAAPPGLSPAPPLPCGVSPRSA